MNIDENILDYLGVREENSEKDIWLELSCLQQMLDIEASTSSTCAFQVHWGASPVIIGEERCHGEI